MIPLKEAQALVLQQAHSFGKQKIPLDDAPGRILCEKITADRDYPPFNRATMDGIAIYISDWENGIRSFIVKEKIFAGQLSEQSITEGECFKIMTGAAVPLSANAVIRKEDLVEKENRLTVTVSEVKLNQNIALQGQDIRQNKMIIDKPALCNAAVITVLASLGYSEAEVEKLPSVAIITTGDEIVNVHEAVNEVQIRNSNIHLLRSLLQKWKIMPSAHEHIKDEATALLAAVKKYQSADILILSGAVSAGEADFVPEVLLQAGAQKIFHRTAIRPGKPLWFGQFENGAVVFALPGNPFSTLVTFKLFIEPFLHYCFGIAEPAKLSLPVAENRSRKTGLDEFFPVIIEGSPSFARPLQFNTSGDITAALYADAIALHPADKAELVKGEIVSCLTL